MGGTENALDAIRWALSVPIADLSPKAAKRLGKRTLRLVLVAFAGYVDANDQAFPSASRLAEDLSEVPRPIVAHALIEAEDQGLLIRVSGNAGGKVVRRLNRRPVGEITTGHRSKPVGESNTGERGNLSGNLWGDLSGKSRQEDEGKNLDKDSPSSSVSDRAREEWGDGDAWSDWGDPLGRVLKEAGLPTAAANRARLVEISRSTPTRGDLTRSPASRLGADPRHAAECLEIYRRELNANRPRCPECDRPEGKRHLQECSIGGDHR